MTTEYVPDPQWEKDCLKWGGKVLTGKWGHYCYDWDDLPIDETCEEFNYCFCKFADEYGEKPSGPEENHDGTAAEDGQKATEPQQGTD